MNRRGAVLLLLLCLACKRAELADAPPTPVRISDAKKFLDRQVAVLRELEATDCGEIRTAIKPPLACAERALQDGHAFYLRVRGGTEAVMFGDARGNVTMFSYEAMEFIGSVCLVGVRPPLFAPAAARLVTIRQRPLMVGASPVGRPPFTDPPRVLTRVPFVKSSAP
ncbi:MAG TPA: hypothetical protein VN181_16190, partial [Thermoanaerobaculia bacterium]|nr:hypothetical protein [Thermoanaerobaculia bacterium]